MPLYEYYCSACKWQFEMLRSIIQSDADASCPECGAPARKALSVVARVASNGGYESLPMWGESSGGGGGCACGGACSCAG